MSRFDSPPPPHARARACPAAVAWIGAAGWLLLAARLLWGAR